MHSAVVRLQRLRGVGFLKRYFPRCLTIFVCVVFGVLISSALYALTGFSLFGGPRGNLFPVSDANDAELSSLAYSILDSIKESDFAALSGAAHPERGILFSPQATVALSKNKCFSTEEIAAFGSDTSVYVWGVYSVSGEPIEMTPAEYFSRFVYFKDYTSAPIVGVNHVVRSGNALENFKDVFPDMQFIEFHVPGGEHDPTEDFNWSTLRLGFEQYNGDLWLTAIIHSEWSV